LWQAVTTGEGAGTQKRVWLSEVGGSVDQVTHAQQALFLTASFDAFAADPRVATAFWFHDQDFPDGSYGLYDAAGLAPANRRPAYAAFTQAVASHRPGTPGPGSGVPGSQPASGGCALSGGGAEAPTIAFPLFVGIFLVALSRRRRC
jgi:hypothetical protein